MMRIPQLLAVIATLLMGAPLTSAQAIDLFSDDAKPQAETFSCQSHAAVLALAALRDPRFPITTFTQLRSMELAFRDAIEIQGGDPGEHIKWSRAMERMTGGRYTIKRSYPSGGIVGWMQAVRPMLGLSSAAEIIVQNALQQPKKIVLTSVNSIEGSTYATGHIVAVLGLVGSGIDSTTKTVVFNGAIKHPASGSKAVCDASTMPGDEKYSAGVLTTSDFQLKGFPGFAVLTLERR